MPQEPISGFRADGIAHRTRDMYGMGHDIHIEADVTALSMDIGVLAEGMAAVAVDMMAEATHPADDDSPLSFLR